LRGFCWLDLGKIYSGLFIAPNLKYWQKLLDFLFGELSSFFFLAIFVILIWIIIERVLNDLITL